MLFRASQADILTSKELLTGPIVGSIRKKEMDCTETNNIAFMIKYKLTISICITYPLLGLCIFLLNHIFFPSALMCYDFVLINVSLC